MFPTFSFSVDDLDAADACSLNRRWGNLTNVCDRVVSQDESFGINVWWVLNTTTPLDVVWSIRMDRINGNEVARLVALKTARLVYAWFVEQYSDGTRFQPFMEYIEQIAARPDMDTNPLDFDEKHNALHRLGIYYLETCQHQSRKTAYSLLNAMSCFHTDKYLKPWHYAVYAADHTEGLSSSLPGQIRDYIFELYGIQPT